LLSTLGTFVEWRLNGGSHINHQSNPSMLLGEQCSLKRAGEAFVSGFWDGVIRIWREHPGGLEGGACVKLGGARVREGYDAGNDNQKSEKNAHQQAPSRRAKSITGQYHHKPCLGS